MRSPGHLNFYLLSCSSSANVYIPSSTAIMPELMATISRLKTIFYALRSLFCWANSVYCFCNHRSHEPFHQNRSQRRWCHSLISEQVNNTGSYLGNGRSENSNLYHFPTRWACLLMIRITIFFISLYCLFESWIFFLFFFFSMMVMKCFSVSA